MQISVIIPTYKRPAKLAACLRGLAAQTLDRGEFEVLVGFDGGDADGKRAAADAWKSAGGGRIDLVEVPRCGYTAVRNHLLARACGRVMLSTNDDVIPDPRLLEVHAREHREAAGRGAPVIVSGASPWVVHEPDRLFDRLVRETSMVFFHDRMSSALAEPMRDWGYRHAWGLNMSAPMDLVRAVGGFTVFPAWYGYEDNEIAFKINRRSGSPVLYRPEARLLHDHRMEPREYLRREYSLGYCAAGFAESSQRCAADMFGRNILDPDEAAYSRQFVNRERTGAARALTAFEALATVPAEAVDGPSQAQLIALAYQAHLPLKRWVWRCGLVDAVDGAEMNSHRPLAQLDE